MAIITEMNQIQRGATDENHYPESDPRHHTQNMKASMYELLLHLREDVSKVKEPKAQALFETSAEVLNGLIEDFEEYEKQNEAASH